MQWCHCSLHEATVNAKYRTDWKKLEDNTTGLNGPNRSCVCKKKESLTHSCKVNNVNRVLRNELLDVVIEAEVDHIKHSIASHCRRYTFVQPAQTKAVFLYDLSSFGKS